jgi:ribosome biogenesis GTPase
MTLKDLGITKEISNYLKENKLSDYTVGRVTQEHRESYIVSTGKKEYHAEITGNLRFTATSRADFPAVGDWVTMIVYDSDLAIIHKILPRISVLERQMVGKPGEKQIISTNVNVAFIIQSVGNNFNINRLERYMTICYSADIEPVLIISKIDLATEEEIRDAVDILESRDKKIKYFLLSNMTRQGLDQIADFTVKGITYCVIGSSGTGKSTLINNLLNMEVLRTGPVSHSTNKGKHITEHRELFVLKNGGIIIDTPGMRELGLTDDDEGINTTFQDIQKIATRCKFHDCKHINEEGCAVIEAFNKGEINGESLENFRKLQREQERFMITAAEKHKKERQFGRIMKDYKKIMKKNN